MLLSSLRGVLQSASFAIQASGFRQIGVVVTIAHENRAEVVWQGRDSFIMIREIALSLTS